MYIYAVSLTSNHPSADDIGKLYLPTADRKAYIYMTDTSLIKHLFSLAKIAADERVPYDNSHQFDDIVRLMDKTADFDEDIAEYRPNAQNYDDLRSDESRTGMDRTLILKNSHNTAHNCFAVPKVV